MEIGKIICGDVLEEMKKIPDNSIHLAITSPPYNVGKDYDNHNDKMEYKEYLEWLNKVWKRNKASTRSWRQVCFEYSTNGNKEFYSYSP